MVKEVIDKYTLIEDRTIGLYFGAGYCDWCKSFSEPLRSVYPFLRSHNIDILLVSSDKSKAAYDAYAPKHPWPAIDYNDSARENLRAKYEIKKIPALVFVDRTGEIIERNGRDLVVYAIENEYDSVGAAISIAKNLNVSGYRYDSDASDF